MGLVKIPSSKVVDILKKQKEILRIEDDAKVVTLKKPTKITIYQLRQKLPWGVDRIDEDQAWTTGTGIWVKVAVMDTGINLDHPDLRLNIKGGFNAIDSNITYPMVFK